jgi:hypothetical protein
MRVRIRRIGRACRRSNISGLAYARRKAGFFSLFAFAWNMPSRTVPLVHASNGAGNAVTGPIAFQFPKKEQPNYTAHALPVNRRFSQKVVGELDPTRAAR